MRYVNVDQAPPQIPEINGFAKDGPQSTHVLNPAKCVNERWINANKLCLDVAVILPEPQ